jgi:hypothetical protein
MNLKNFLIFALTIMSILCELTYCIENSNVNSFQALEVNY